MKNGSTATRLKQIMQEKNLRQVDILEKCKPFCDTLDVKLGRNDLSQYVNGKVEPGQEKLTILGLALNVSEAWLMGFDVPMERHNDNTQRTEPPGIMRYYDQLNTLGKETATEQVRLLTLDGKYTRSNQVISVVREPEPDYLAPNAAHLRERADAADQEYDDKEFMDNDALWKK